MDEAKNKINDLEHKKAKNDQSEQQEKRMQKKKKGLCKQSLEQLQVYQHLHHRGARRRRERARNWKSILKIVKEKFPNLVKEIDM